MKCEFGFCTVCEKEIAKPCASCSKRTPTNDYTEVQIEWSNGSKMQIALCVECAKSHAWATAESKKGITEAHWRAWDKMNHSYSREIVVA